MFYNFAREDKAEVDHIVPLNHPMVCGLHSHDNLQIVTKEFNQFKVNLFWPNMPAYTEADYRELYGYKS